MRFPMSLFDFGQAFIFEKQLEKNTCSETEKENT